MNGKMLSYSVILSSRLLLWFYSLITILFVPLYPNEGCTEADNTKYHSKHGYNSGGQVYSNGTSNPQILISSLGSSSRSNQSSYWWGNGTRWKSFCHWYSFVRAVL